MSPCPPPHYYYLNLPLAWLEGDGTPRSSQTLGQLLASWSTASGLFLGALIQASSRKGKGSTTGNRGRGTLPRTFRWVCTFKVV